MPNALLRREFLYDEAPFPSCHASTLVETPGGLVAAFFGGSKEGEPDVSIYVCPQIEGRWSAPVEAANGSGEPCWNSVLFKPADGPVMLFYKVGPNPSSWWGMLKSSDDDGRTWGDAIRLPDGILGPI